MDSAVIVAGLHFGDEGKGTITDALVRKFKSPLVVRYNGGPQAAHHVVLGDGKWHAFHQFSSGTFAGARTHLSRFTLVDPFSLAHEATALRAQGIVHPFGRVSMDPRCLVVTPYHMCMNRLRELARGDERHGSCGMGIGEAVSDHLARPSESIHAGRLAHFSDLTAFLETIRLKKRDEADALGLDASRDPAGVYLSLLRSPTASRDYAKRYSVLAADLHLRNDEALLDVLDGTVIFEGAQGVLLDEDFGFWPYVTWSKTTFEHALELVAEVGGQIPTQKVGVVRSYMTRHGAGPLPTQGTLTVPEPHNTTGAWQGAVRTGLFDLPLTRFAANTCCMGIDLLAVTHLDRVGPGWGVVDYEGGYTAAKLGHADFTTTATPTAAVFLAELRRHLAVPVLQSWGPTPNAKRWPTYTPSELVS